jgi:peptidoglycan-associated lipoprotein
MKEVQMSKGYVRLVLIVVLAAAVAMMLGCGGKKLRSLEDEEAAMEAARRKAAEEEEARRAREAEEAIKPIKPAEEKSIELGAIYFDYDKYNLSGKALSTLSENAEMLMNDPNMNVVIEGHCDERGTDEYNLALGEKRAQAARDFLVNFGIAKSRISVISFGEERPVDPGHNEEAWAKNRRAEFVTK